MPLRWLKSLGTMGVSLLAVAVQAPFACGQTSMLNPNPPEEPKETTLELSCQALPDPLWRYRFVPLTSELNPGNAAPVYLRLDQQTSSESIREMHKKAVDWAKLPLASVPQAEARKLVEDFAGRLRQLEFGARRRYCDWDYTILEEKDNPFAILLPDAQAMRAWGWLLITKTRSEIAAGQADQAIATLETGIAFGQHVGEGPFLINKLIGLAIISGMLAQVDELIGQPTTPNLYWALTLLPEHLVSMRAAVENERVSIGRTLTGQTLDEFDLTRSRTDAEWSALLADLHGRMVRAEKLMGPDWQSTAPTLPNLEAYKTAMLPQARAYLREHHLLAASDAQALVVALISMYRELADQNFKLAYVAYPEAIELQRAATDRIKAAKTGPAACFVALLPAVSAALLSEVQVARKVAILRVIEALRLFAAAHDGAFPATLDEIKSLPIPLDPGVNRPFVYRRDGTTAFLAPTQLPATKHLAYRLTIRP